MQGVAVVLAPGVFKTDSAKTAHGLVRGSDRFRIVGVVDAAAAGEDAGMALDGRRRDIPVFASLAYALDRARPCPDTCIVGVATAGGTLPPELRALLLEAAERGLHIVSGLHQAVGDDPEIAAAAAKSGARILDVRKARPAAELHFWTGAIAHVRAPRIAVLGTDCALGKRTTARLLVDALCADGVRAEMIYTGQTGWMEGARHGFILDATINDFVSGELEHAILTCEREAAPDVMIIEGQSSLRNPSGPCGAELIVSAQARWVILQHAPGRTTFKSRPGWPLPPIEEEVQLCRLYGAEVVAVALNGERLTEAALVESQLALVERLALPVVRPLEEGAAGLTAITRRIIDRELALGKY